MVELIYLVSSPINNSTFVTLLCKLRNEDDDFLSICIIIPHVINSDIGENSKRSLIIGRSIIYIPSATLTVLELHLSDYNCIFNGLFI